MSATIIPPALRAQLKTLRLTARRAASDGIGQHVSRNRGDGLEFAQYRGYEPGDEPRRIDWKLFARSDRYYVRESERDSALTTWLLVDATASMAQADEARASQTKLDTARLLAACVIELALRQGDRFGVIAFSAGRIDLVPAGNGPRHRDRCLLQLAGLRPKGEWPDETALRLAWERIGADQLALLLSDGFDDAATDLLVRLANARREVLDIQLLCGDERDFGFGGNRRFIDHETGSDLRTDAPASRAAFIAAFSAARAARAARLAAAGIRHVEAWIDRPPIEPLRTLFGRRDEQG